MSRRSRGRRGGWRRLADLSLRPSSSRFKPYRANADLKSFEVYLSDDGDRLVIREWRDQHSGALSDFVVMQQTLESGMGEWRDVVLVDTRHQVVHVHCYNSVGEEISRKDFEGYATRVDLENIYGRIYDYVFDAWEVHRRQWASG